MHRSLCLISTFLITMALLSLACSGANDPLSPGGLTGQSIPQLCLGEFQIIPGEDMESAEIVSVRDPQFDVTKWAKIQILSTYWDEIMRTWTLTVKISNPLPHTGWGVQAIFTELGGKELRWPDGFLWMNIDGNPGDERVPFFAVEKTTPDRKFSGFHACTQDFTFHFPEGVNKWIPIKFFIDASIHGPRPQPMVEDLDMAYFPPPCYHSTVTARIGDHQSKSSDLNVWVDLSSMGGSSTEALFDDGQHDDAFPNDGIFGARFSGGNFGVLYTFTVYAEDPDGNRAENDIMYSPIGYPPLPPVPYETLMQGPDCLLTDEWIDVISDQAAFDDFWGKFAPWDMPPPVIDWQTKRLVVVCIGQRPNSCYSVEVNNVDWTSENCGWKVSYTETVPGPNCSCNQVITSPFHLVLVNNAAFDIMFEGAIFEDDCPDKDPCIDLTPVASGSYGLATGKSMAVIEDQKSWEMWWMTNVGSPVVPAVDFTVDNVFAVTMGQKNTSGYYPTIDSACLDDADQLEITVGWHIPDKNCLVMDVITHPFLAVSGKKAGLSYYWTEYDDIYKCD